MKAPLTFWTFAFVCSAFSSFATETSNPYVRGAQCVEKKFSSMKGITDIVNWASTQKQIVSAENFRMELIRSLQANPEISGKPIYERIVDSKGKEIDSFAWGFYPAKDLDDPKLVRERLQAFCNQFLSQYPKIVIDRCVESHFARIVEGPSSHAAFHKLNQSTEMELANEALENPDRHWSEHVSGKKIEVDSAEMGYNLELGQNLFMPYQYLKRRFGGDPTPVTNKSGQAVGILIPIDYNGTMKYYFAEARGKVPILQLDEFLWPYHFVFGSDLQDEWNSAFEQRHGGLFVRGRPLSEFTRKG